MILGPWILCSNFLWSFIYFYFLRAFFPFSLPFDKLPSHCFLQLFLFLLVHLYFPFYWISFFFFLSTVPFLVSRYQLTSKSLPLCFTYALLFLTRHIISSDWSATAWLLCCPAKKRVLIVTQTGHYLVIPAQFTWRSILCTYGFCYPHEKLNTLYVLRNYVSLTAGNVWEAAIAKLR